MEQHPATRSVRTWRRKQILSHDDFVSHINIVNFQSQLFDANRDFVSVLAGEECRLTIPTEITLNAKR